MVSLLDGTLHSSCTHLVAVVSGTGSADSTCSLETLQRACRLLVFLANYAPLEADRDPSCDDIVRRLSNLDFFVDFKSSGCDARCVD
jgi:hypothetical protein